MASTGKRRLARRHVGQRQPARPGGEQEADDEQRHEAQAHQQAVRSRRWHGPGHRARRRRRVASTSAHHECAGGQHQRGGEEAEPVRCGRQACQAPTRIGRRSAGAARSARPTAPAAGSAASSRWRGRCAERRANGCAKRHARRQQALDQLAHGADLRGRTAARRRRGRTGPSSRRRASRRRAGVSMQNWPQPGRPSRRPHCARQSKAMRAARLHVRLGLQPWARPQVVVEPRRAHGARRQPGDAGELDQVFVARLGQHLLERRVRVAFLGDGERRAELHRGGAERLHARDVLVGCGCRRPRSAAPRARCRRCAGTPAPAGSRCSKSKRGSFRSADLGRAEVAAGQARVLDDDGVGQALLAFPLAAPRSCTPRASDRIGISAALRVVARQVGQIQRQAGADHHRVDAGLERARHRGGVLARPRASR